MIRLILIFLLAVVLTQCVSSIDLGTVIKVPTLEEVFFNPFVDVVCNYEMEGDRVRMHCIDMYGDSYIMYKGGRS